ncbi:MAG: CDP-diacylglycerol--serine O-phosphatidyltransferase [Hyphomicrobiales bacterium]|nr:MAG: CDP-diacylglycerol--serine O-phosphatidyltransferase [Hyphomicrobiales bacterium]
MPDTLRPHNKPPRTRRFSRVPVNVLIPNMITLLALCSGLTAIRMGLEGRFELAIAAIIVAAVLDALDGRVARMLKGVSRFGAELDSLVDFVNFGVAPALLLYIWTLQELKSVGWIAVLGFALCMALRLARFNVQLDDPDKPVWKSNFFTGVPAPAGAALLLLPLYLNKLGMPYIMEAHMPIVVFCAMMSFLLVSRIPTYSGKLLGQRVKRDAVLPVMILVVLFAAILLSFPWATLTILSLLYLAAIPFGVIQYRKLDKATQARSHPAAS